MDTLPPQPLLLTLLIILVLGFITAYAKAASIAINDTRLATLAEENPKAKRLYDALSNSPASVINALSSFKGFWTILFVVLAAFGFSDETEDLLINCGFDSSGILLYILEIAIPTVIITIIHSVFWNMLPERLSAKYSEKVALALSGYTLTLAAVAKPFICVPALFSNIAAWIFGVRQSDLTEDVTEEEIRMLVDIGSESGAIDDDEKEMIHNIFELDDKLVGDVMTHRKEACILWMEDSLEDWKSFIYETNHSRYPVCDEDIDNVIGIINTRDFYRFLLGGGQKNTVRSIMRKPYFVPDSMKADELFSRMQQKNTHIVVVMDEYGGFLGLATQEDLLEEIVGDLRSEYEEPEDLEISNIDENTWKIKGSAEIEDVEKALKVVLPEGDYNTFAGLILDSIGTLPEDGETVETEIDNLQIKVTSVMEHRIEEAIVCLNRDLENEESHEE